ncbi:GAF domain-containing protein [Clostridium grantii]|uniref:GAF domain-containing protein n=1 Tax=Clostridium grantii DSM 8605 TaxID=1121316 RepID=A0A1M5ULL1_9CLOT|nr:GAF domain-containing protein [Clostridium grantii]SHH63932.1 GAF domain-containing protein [Clostridium grantii DSM 8605]
MNRKDNYETMILMLKGQLQGEDNSLANICNATAIINEMMDDINWVGFYFMNNKELFLGPFQGKPACNRIAIGRGVCGTAVSENKIMMVDDVHEFKGHIACDSASNSEIVIPISSGDKVYGVLDIDSPTFNRFSQLEKEFLIKFVDMLNENINWEELSFAG